MEMRFGTFAKLVESGDSFAVVIRTALDHCERGAAMAQRRDDDAGYQHWTSRQVELAFMAREYVDYITGGK